MDRRMKVGTTGVPTYLTGVVYEYNDGEMGDALISFGFNELTTENLTAFDRANRKLAAGNASGLSIDLKFEGRLDDVALAGLGGNADKGFVGKYLYALRESGASGSMDYYGSGSLGDYSFFLVENTAYNPMDAGNFVWGAAMSQLGISYPMAVAGSQVNAVFSGKRQNNAGSGLTLRGDSKADQRAIRNGYVHNMLRSGSWDW